MIQPYLSSVESTDGELSVIGIDGAWTHAIGKSPRFEGKDENVSQALAVSSEEAEIADRCLDSIPEEVFYIRIDLIRDDEAGCAFRRSRSSNPRYFCRSRPQPSTGTSRAWSESWAETDVDFWQSLGKPSTTPLAPNPAALSTLLDSRITW